MPSDQRIQGGQVYRTWQDARHTVTAPHEQISPPSWKPTASAYVLMFLAHFLLTFLGLRLLLGTNGALLFWPAIGLSVGFLLLLDRSHWLRYLAGIAAVNFLANLAAGTSPPACVMFAATNVVETLVPVLLYRKLVDGQEWRLQSVRSVITFTLGAAVASPAVTGLLGTAASVMAFGSSDPARTWFIWWVTAMTGTLVMAPLVISWAGWRPHGTGTGRVREIGQAILTFGLFAVLLEFLLGTHLPVSLPVFSRTYLAFPLLFLWAYRYGMRGCTSAMVPITAVMIWNAMDGAWSFQVPGAAFPRPVTIQLYIAVLAMSGMLFAAMLSERSVILDRLRTHAERVRDVARRLEVQVDRLPLGLIMLDRGAVVREWNPAAETIFGWTSRETVGHALVDRIVPFDRRERFRRYLEEAEKTDRSISAIIPAVRKGGAAIHAEWHLTPLRDEHGALQGMLATVRDVTERDRADARIHRLNRLYAFLSQINQAIVRARTRADLFRDVCSIALEFGKFRFAWIAEIRPGAQRLTPLVSAGHAGAYLDLMGAADLSRPEVRRTPVVASILSQEIQVVQDLAADPRIELWREEGLKYGFGSYASLPVRVPGVFDGNLNVYAADPDSFDTEVLGLLNEVRGDIVFAIENLDREGRRAAMEQTLQESEVRFRTIVQSIDDLVFTLDREQRHTGVYGGGLLRTGMTAEFFLGRTPEEILGPEMGAFHRQFNERALAGEAVTYEWSFGTGDTRTHFSTSVAPRYDESGAIIGVTGVARDITPRKRMEDEIRESRQLFFDVFHFSPMPTALLRFDTLVYVDVNQAYERITGLERDDLVGRPVGSFDWYVDDAVRTQAIEQLRRVGKIDGMEFDLRSRNGGIHHVVVYATLVAMGSEQFLVAKLLDITDRKAAEDMVKEERALLAQRVEERTAELSLANAALGRAARLKDEFLASMSHELRTPLTGILGMAEALQMQVYGSLNDRQLRSVRTIEESGKHLLSLINDILDLSKIEAGKLELQPNTVVVRDICESALVMVRQLAHRKNLKLTLTIDDTVRTLRADPRRLKQVLVNLVSNAVKFTPEGGSVSLEVHGDAAHGRMRFLCRDTGIGIHQDDFSRLFQPFVQLDSSLARQFSGTGLGLSLVHRMVELHGGSVDVESTPGQGSVFTVSLPWEQAAEPGEQRAATAPVPGSAPEGTAESGRPHLLIAEDNETTLSLFTDFFQESGYTVTAARNGAEAIQVFDTCTPAVMIVDVQMPGIDGLAAIRTIRDAERRSGRARVPVVALTALTMPGDRERCLEAGADVYLAKPVHLTTLADTVQDILRRKG